MKESSGSKYEKLADILGRLHKSPHYAAAYPFSRAARDELMIAVGEEGLRTLSFAMNVSVMLKRWHDLNWKKASRSVDKARTGLLGVIDGLGNLPTELLWPVESIKPGTIDTAVEVAEEGVQYVRAVLDSAFDIIHNRDADAGPRLKSWQLFLGFMVVHVVAHTQHSVARYKGSELVQVLFVVPERGQGKRNQQIQP